MLNSVLNPIKVIAQVYIALGRKIKINHSGSGYRAR